MRMLRYAQESPGKEWRRISETPSFVYDVSPKGERFRRGVRPDPRRVLPFSAEEDFTPAALAEIVDLIRSQPTIPTGKDERLLTKLIKDPSRRYSAVQSISKYGDDEIEVWTGISMFGEIFHLRSVNGHLAVVDASDWSE